MILTTLQVAELLGISAKSLRKYKDAHLKNAPNGSRGAGRGHQLIWTEDSIKELIDHRERRGLLGFVKTLSQVRREKAENYAEEVIQDIQDE